MTPTGQSRLRKAEARIRAAEADLLKARIAWAKAVRELGISAVARELGVTPQAVSSRVEAAERASKGEQ